MFNYKKVSNLKKEIERLKKSLESAECKEKENWKSLTDARTQINRYLTKQGLYWAVVFTDTEAQFKRHLDEEDRKAQDAKERDKMVGIVLDLVKKGSLKEGV